VRALLGLAPAAVPRVRLFVRRPIQLAQWAGAQWDGAEWVGGGSYLTLTLTLTSNVTLTLTLTLSLTLSLTLTRWAAAVTARGASGASRALRRSSP